MLDTTNIQEGMDIICWVHVLTSHVTMDTDSLVPLKFSAPAKKHGIATIQNVFMVMKKSDYFHQVLSQLI